MSEYNTPFLIAIDYAATSKLNISHFLVYSTIQHTPSCKLQLTCKQSPSFLPSVLSLPTVLRMVQKRKRLEKLDDDSIVEATSPPPPKKRNQILLVSSTLDRNNNNKYCTTSTDMNIPKTADDDAVDASAATLIPRRSNEPSIKRITRESTRATRINSVTPYKTHPPTTTTSSRRDQNQNPSMIGTNGQHSHSHDHDHNSNSNKVLADPPGYPPTPGLKKKRDPLESLGGIVMGDTTTIHEQNEIGEEDHEDEDNDEDDSSVVTITIAQPQMESNQKHNQRPLVTISSWIYYSLRLGIASILLFVALSVYQTHMESTFMKDVIHSELKNTLLELDHLQIQKEAVMKNLTSIQHDWKESRKEHFTCLHHLESSKGGLEKLEQHNLFLQSRLENMSMAAAGTEDAVQISLQKAWERMDQLREEKSVLSLTLEWTNDQLSSIVDRYDVMEVERQVCNDRVVELELDSVGQETRVVETLSVVDQYKKELDLLQWEFNEQQDLVALLQHQLEEENGHSWYYDLQMQYLNTLQVELEGKIGDSKYENSELTREVQRLKRQIFTENEQAVAALNAVARIATLRKAEQVAVVEHSAESRIENVKKEAANAMNSVLSAMIGWICLMLLC